jgi:hypothetical protein
MTLRRKLPFKVPQMKVLEYVKTGYKAQTKSTGEQMKTK